VAGVFLLAHAFVHPWLWAFPSAGNDPPQGESWLLHGVFGMGSAAQSTTAVIAWAATVLFAVAGVVLLARRASWRAIAGSAATLSLVAIVLDFTLGLVVGLAIDVVILAVALTPPAIDAPGS
jgi:hypothetical protein